MSADRDHDREHQPRVVTTAGNGPEAEMMCELLAAEGIPAMQQRLIDNPEFGQAGPRSILVRASDLERARDALGLEATPQPDEER
jgi:Putative prokaryotic signal transducing protein